MPATIAEKNHLSKIVHQWNENRLDLFSLTDPDEDLEFHGVMRFYFQESGQKVVTKCIRVSSTATTRAVIEALVMKFHPDLKMLTTPRHSIWEVHENGDERRLAGEEKPLLVQLNWHKDDREGRFLFKREGVDQYSPLAAMQLHDSNRPGINRDPKRFSKRNKREAKKKFQRELADANRPVEAEDVASKLYHEVPTTTFTRTISNPEIVMKKRRERKLESKLKGIGKGGSLKIYGSELSSARPYITLLVSVQDQASTIVQETLDKYGIDQNEDRFCLAEVLLKDGRSTPIGERFLADDECPLVLLSKRADSGNGRLIFEIRRRSGTLHRQKETIDDSICLVGSNDAVRSFLIQLNPDGSQMADPKVFPITPNVTEIGSDKALTQQDVQSIPVQGANVYPRHCILAFIDGVVTVTPCNPNAKISVQDHPVTQTTILRHGFLLTIGRSHVFRFLQSNTSDIVSIGGSMSNIPAGNCQQTSFEHLSSRHKMSFQMETTFDLDGKIDSFPMGESAKIEQDLRIRPSRNLELGIHQNPSISHDSIPALIELADNAEKLFLNSVIRDLDHDRLQFKLAPIYTLYMACRFRLCPHYRPCLLPEERAANLAEFATKIINMLHVTIQDHCHSKEALAVWISNSSELLNVVKCDVHIGPATHPEPQESLANAVEKAFGHLTSCLRLELQGTMPAILDNCDDLAATDPCLRMLASTMSLLRQCRLNAALTIQLFSQLFHFINMYLFNWLVSLEGSDYCSKKWGRKLASRLDRIKGWAERQGLELAAECHMDRIVQAVNLLQTDKTTEHLAILGATCYKLNSLQVNNLLERYKSDDDESEITADLVANVVKVAVNQADEMLRSEGHSVQVEEDIDLHLPFLLPDDGYTPEILLGIPSGLRHFVNRLQDQGICRLVIQSISSGQWNVYLNSRASDPVDSDHCSSSQEKLDENQQFPQGKAPEIVTIKFHKGSGGIGLSIVAAQGVGDRDVGIYVKKIVPGSVAQKDGRLQAGDQLLSVNGQGLIGITQEEAAQKMARSGTDICFEVSKKAAMYNGLANCLYQSSPQAFHAPPGSGIDTYQNPCTNGLVNGNTQQQRQRQEQQIFGSAGSLRPQRTPQIYGTAPKQTARFQPRSTMNRQVPTVEPIATHNRSVSASELSVQPKGQVSTRQHSHYRLPGHYRPANSSLRQQPVAEDDNSHANRNPIPSFGSVSSSSSVHYPQSTLTDYQNLPLIDERQRRLNSDSVHNRQFSSSSPIEHSSSSSESPTVSGQHRVSAPIYGERLLRVEQEVLGMMQDELSRLENKPELTEGEKRRYRALLYEIAYQKRLNEEERRIGGSRPNSDDFSAAVVLADQARLAAIGSSADSTPLSMIQRQQNRDRYFANAESKLINEEVNRQRARRTSSPVIEEDGGQAEDGLDEPMGAMNIHGGNLLRRPPQVPPKQIRRVQFRTVQEVDPTKAIQETNGDGDDVEQDKRYVFDGEECERPRVKVLGTQEVYKDPRQKRLDERQGIQMVQGQKVDGSNLGFKDKMRLFAQQIGENTPKNRFKTSSAQRDIEDQLDQSQ